MQLPYLQAVENVARRQIINFGGLNYGQGYRDGELQACTNLTSAEFPALAVRRGRQLVHTYAAPTALFAKGKLCVVDGTDLLYDGAKVGTVSLGQKQMVSIGASIVIWPDKLYYNTSTREFGALENTYVSAAGKIKFESAAIVTTGTAFTGFKEGDAVTITGCNVNAANNKTATIRAVEDKKLTFYDNTFTAGTETGIVILKRKVPDLTCVCENNNRLWGCEGNTIYSCKLGDPFNWFVYDGLSTDSYAVAVGSDGEFTGCIAYGSHIAFFKEDLVHKLMGNKPANYQLVTANVYGVQQGCAGSMKIINETLYYKGRGGVYAYSGGVPELVSDAFGQVRFSEAVAETDGERYYIAMKRGDGWGLYVYDVTRGLWHREDGTHAVGMAFLDGTVYFIDGAGGLYAMNRPEAGEQVEWSVTFCPFTEQVEERKCFSRLGMRLTLAAGAYISVEMRTDGGPWKRLMTSHNERARTMQVPVAPNRCDRFEVRFSGKGYCKLEYFTRELQLGGVV